MSMNMNDVYNNFFGSDKPNNKSNDKSNDQTNNKSNDQSNNKSNADTDENFKGFATCYNEMDRLQKNVEETAAEINERIKELNLSLAKDFGEDVVSSDSNSSREEFLKDLEKLGKNEQKEINLDNKKNGEKNGEKNDEKNDEKTGEAGATGDKKAQEGEDETATNILSSFKGLNQEISEQVFGQEEFIKKLIVAFKRPFVTQRLESDAMNSMFVTGPECSGKHLAVKAITEELFKRKIIDNSEIFTMDLSLYKTEGEEKIFLQDLYSALSGKAKVILLENFKDCNVTYLGKISELVSTGKCRLSERYVLQKGQLINVSNSLSGNAVSSFYANGKYLILMSSLSVEKLADFMGAPFVNSLGDICVANPLSEDAIAKISQAEGEKLVRKAKNKLALSLNIDKSYVEYVCNKANKQRGAGEVLTSFNAALKALEELRLQMEDDFDEANLKFGKLKSVKNEDAAEIPFIEVSDKEYSVEGLIPIAYRAELDSVEKEIEAIVGLKEVKAYIYELKGYYELQKKRREQGLKTSEVNKHMIFTGNPGTGKTTIARLVSKYLKAIGVLNGGQLVEVSRAELVGKYVGHTAPLVNQVIKSALGGVLFIDEAYSLYRGGEDSFGLEAIDALVKGIEDNRDNLIVILAGYSKEMADFLEANSGLKSRFPNIIDFPDYTGEELLKIAEITANSKGYRIDSRAKASLLEYFNKVQQENAREAGNGRLVRNKVEEAILNQSKRLTDKKSADMEKLLKSDFELD